MSETLPARPTATARPSPWAAAAADFAAHRAGDPEALDRLVRRLTPLLWHVVRSYRLDRATAEDVVQTTWLALVRNAGAIDDPKAVARWLTVTARREAWRCARSGRRAEPLPEDLAETAGDTDEGPEPAAVRSGRDAALWTAVDALSERCRRLLRVVAFAARPDYHEVSRRLGMPVGSIGPTRGRCLAKLRERLAADGWEQL